MHELKQHKPCFVEECFVFLYKRKQDKMNWMQGPSQSNVDNINIVRRKPSKHLRGGKRLKLRNMKLTVRRKNSNILYGSINDFKKDYQP
jgi:hypothetical protein